MGRSCNPTAFYGHGCIGKLGSVQQKSPTIGGYAAPVLHQYMAGSWNEAVWPVTWSVSVIVTSPGQLIADGGVATQLPS
jgi:hypothetical protein